MTRYEKITSLKDEFLSLMKLGFIPSQLLAWKVYYEAYLEEKNNLKKLHGKAMKNEAVEITAAYYKVSSRSIYRVIQFMEGN